MLLSSRMLLALIGLQFVAPGRIFLMKLGPMLRTNPRLICSSLGPISMQSFAFHSLPPSCDAPTSARTAASDVVITASENIQVAPSTLVDPAPSASVESATPAAPIAPVVVNIESSVKGDASSGLLTHDKKTRFKRAAKEELTPPKLKKMKVSEDVEQTYSTFVMNGRKFKSHPKDRAP